LTLAALFWCSFPVLCAAQPAALPEVLANDNRRFAGSIQGGTLTVRLVAERGQWRPEEQDGPALEIAAFREEGGQLRTPGPLLRAPEGTRVVAYIRNGLSQSLVVHGLVTHPAGDDTVTVRPGETREIAFTVGVAGTYSYWATTTGGTMGNRTAFDSQLGGAFVVDSPGQVLPDRVLVMSEWNDSRVRIDELISPDVRRVFGINGRSWPHTEALTEQVGRETRWRVVNLTQTAHPMHLHGFYFEVRAIGTSTRQASYLPSDYRTVVTEFMPVGGTMLMAWTPERTGNWLLHCHLLSHITPALRFWKKADVTGAHSGHDTHDAAAAMAGLVMGIRVTGESAARIADLGPPRRLTLTMRTRPGHWKPEDGLGFVLTEGVVSKTAPVMVPGPVLVLERDRPVEITVTNELPEATAIHWHGIELESYFDGVPGWSGSSLSTTPPIVGGQSFVVRFTPPRAGTFIYHTHSHDVRQLAAGLYGAIVVLEPGERFDPSQDHVVMLGMGGPKDTQNYDRFPVVVNGDAAARLRFKAGVPNRLRLINITTNFSGLNVSVMGANQPLPWRPIAKDGADLPASQQVVRPALRQRVGVGETYDFVIDPPRSGQTWIEVRRAGGEWVQQVPVNVAP
jgi:FtsP/CotA-like multicopper oxidase with cupredoxin domain